MPLLIKSCSKTTQLEQKLESLVNLLSTTRGIAPSTDQPTPPDSHGQSEPSPIHELGPLAKPHASQEPWAPGLPARDVTGPFDARCTAFTSVACAGACGIQPEAAPTPHSPPNASFDRLLRLFKQKHAPHFPFVIIPSDLSACQLHIQKPWLLRVIVFVACQENRIQQLEMSKAYLLDISAAMLLRGEKSLDMLQSLIIYNAWSYTHGHVRPSSHSTGIFQLALGMAFDLGLTKQYREVDSPGEVLMHTINEGVPLASRREMRRSFDEMRALLCCYVLTTV